MSQPKLTVYLYAPLSSPNQLPSPEKNTPCLTKHYKQYLSSAAPPHTTLPSPTPRPIQISKFQTLYTPEVLKAAGMTDGTKLQNIGLMVRGTLHGNAGL